MVDTESSPGPSPDASTPVIDDDLDEARLYQIVRAAVKDALLDVIGTLLLLGIAFVLVLAGGQVLFEVDSSVEALVGIGLLVVGLFLAATTLELVPPIREWV